MAPKVLLFQWAGSAYDSLRGLLRLVGSELQEEGVEVISVTIDTPDFQSSLLHLLATGNVICAIGMSGVGADAFVNNECLLWEKAKVPFFNWNCDHPCYFPSRHAIRSPYLLHGYVFPDHARYTQEHLNPNGVAFSAHLGIPPSRIFGDRPFSISERNGRIVFTKSSADTLAIEAKWRAMPPPIRQLAFAGAEELAHRSTGEFLPTFQRLAESLGIHLSGNSALTLALIREVDAYIRFRRTNLVLEALKDYPIDVYGVGWNHIDLQGRRAVLKGPIPWSEMTPVLPRYLGCLSLNPLIEESVHDRTFFAIGAGVVPIANSNAFSRAHMPELETYAYRFDVESIRGAVDAMLADPSKAIQRVEEARMRLAGEFSLKQSVRRILSVSTLVPFNARCAQ